MRDPSPDADPWSPATWAHAVRPGDGAALRAEATQRGAVWVDRAGVSSAEAVEAAVQELIPVPGRYTFGQSDRAAVRGPVYTSTAYPARAAIPLHGELSYVRRPPRWLVFACLAAPESGGETTLACGAALLDALPATVADRFARRGITYRKVMHGGAEPGPHLGKSWQRHFETDDRAAVEAHLTREDATWEWGPDGGLVVTLRRPAVRAHADLGRPVWAAQAVLWDPSHLGELGARLRRLLGPHRLPTSVTFGDGGPIAERDLLDIRAAGERVTWPCPWKAGGLLLVDNARVLHGRAPYRGRRQVLVAMGDDP
jgi:alpha-ketoglutarate-dependent taurine dioxygenase